MYTKSFQLCWGDPKNLQPIHYFFGFDVLKSIIGLTFLYPFFQFLCLHFWYFFSNLLIFSFISFISSSIISSNASNIFVFPLFSVSVLISFLVFLSNYLLSWSCIWCVILVLEFMIFVIVSSSALKNLSCSNFRSWNIFCKMFFTLEKGIWFLVLLVFISNKYFNNFCDANLLIE